MTVINVLLQREAGYLFTDAAWYDSEGVVVYFAPKLVNLPHWPGVVAARGPAEALHLAAAEISSLFTDFDAFAADPADFLKGFCERRADMLDDRPFELTVMGWSKSLDRPRAIFVSSHGDDGLSAPADAAGDTIEVEGYQVIEIEAGAMRPCPSADAIARQGLDLDVDIEAMEPNRFGTRIFMAQRELRDAITPGGEPVALCGGYMAHSIVHRNLVSSGRSRDLMDRVGERIDPERSALRWAEANPEPASHNRAVRRAEEKRQRRQAMRVVR